MSDTCLPGRLSAPPGLQEKVQGSLLLRQVMKSPALFNDLWLWFNHDRLGSGNEGVGILSQLWLLSSASPGALTLPAGLSFHSGS